MPDGTYRVRPFFHMEGPGYLVTSEELIIRNALLPRIIEGLCRSIPLYMMQPDADAELVWETLRATENNVLHVIRGHQGPLFFSSLSNINTVKDSSHLVSLTGRVVTFRGMGDAGPDLPYVSLVEVQVHYINRDVLEKQFPGWSERWAAGQALGLQSYDLTKYIFRQSPDVAGLPVSLVFDSVG